MAGERDPPIIPRMANGDRETSETAYVCRLRNIGETAPAGRRQTKRKTMSNNRMTKEDFLANRKAAGRMIDVETCKIMKSIPTLAIHIVSIRLPSDFITTCFGLHLMKVERCMSMICRRTSAARCSPASSART
jgi:hypothetical protein